MIFGTSGYATQLGTMMGWCQRCRNNCPQHIVRRGSKFSLFFIPLFPVSSHYGIECEICRATRRLDKDEAERLAEQINSGAPIAGQAPQQGF